MLHALTGRYGGPLPSCLLGKGAVEAAVDVEVDDKVLKQGLLSDTRHRSYLKQWRDGYGLEKGGAGGVHKLFTEQARREELAQALTDAKAARFESVYGSNPYAVAVSVELNEMKVGNGEGEVRGRGGCDSANLFPAHPSTPPSLSSSFPRRR